MFVLLIDCDFDDIEVRDDSCYWLPDGDYKPRKLPDAMYISCKNGHASTKLCSSNEVFNPWTSKCGELSPAATFRRIQCATDGIVVEI